MVNMVQRGKINLMSWCEKGPFSLSVNCAQTRVLHACVKEKVSARLLAGAGMDYEFFLKHIEGTLRGLPIHIKMRANVGV